MARKKIKMRITLKGTDANVKVLMFHPMETGLRKNKSTGEVIPAHFIKEVYVEHNGTRVLTALMGIAVSKNPFMSFKVLNANSGDTLAISWVDNLGETDSTEKQIQ